MVESPPLCETPCLREFTRMRICFSFFSGTFCLHHGTMPSANWVHFFPLLPSAPVWKWRLWTSCAVRNTGPGLWVGVCCFDSTDISASSFPETWRFIIAVFCLGFLWLLYSSPKSRPGTWSSRISLSHGGPGFLWRLWGRACPGNCWYFLACGHITPTVDFTPTWHLPCVCFQMASLYIDVRWP